MLSLDASRSAASRARLNPGFPQLFHPDSATAARAPLAWLTERLADVQAAVRSAGVVVLRGFAIEDPETFRSLAVRVGGPLGESYQGPSPRVSVAKNVYTASEVPSALVIPEHAEMSYLPRMTRHLYFWCRQPAASGGATTFVDGRRLLERFDPQRVAPLLSAPVRVRRRHAAGRFHVDPFELKPWQATFGTEDCDEALARARELGFTARFEFSGALTLENEQWLVRHHPETGERAWLNHLLVFHASAPEAILASAFEREREVLALAARPLASAYRRGSARIGRSVATDVRYADGSPIADEVVAHVRKVVDENAVAHAWQRGDLAIVDNHIALHGRRPFRGARSVAVAFSAAFA